MEIEIQIYREKYKKEKYNQIMKNIKRKLSEYYYWIFTNSSDQNYIK